MSINATLKHAKTVPLGVFAATMGFAGLTVSLQSLGQIISSSGIELASQILLILTVAIYTLTTLAYLYKLYINPKAAYREAVDPVGRNFLAGIAIGLQLMSVSFLTINEGVSLALWLVGTLLSAGVLIYILSGWLFDATGKLESAINPAILMPIASTMLIPIAGASFAPPEILWIFLATGLLMLPPIYARLATPTNLYAKLPERLRPTYFILIAPPMIGAVSLLGMGIDSTITTLLYSFGVALSVVVIGNIRKLTPSKFFVSWWAYTFPLAASAIASFKMHQYYESGIYLTLGLIYLTLLVLTILIVSYKSVEALSKLR